VLFEETGGHEYFLSVFDSLLLEIVFLSKLVTVVLSRGSQRAGEGEKWQLVQRRGGRGLVLKMAISGGKFRVR